MDKRREAILQHRRQQAQAQKMQKQPVKKTMWDMIAEDTMKTTLREQFASDKKTQMENWQHIITAEENVDDSPLKHLKNASQGYSHNTEQYDMNAINEIMSGEQNLKHALLSDDTAPSPAMLAKRLASGASRGDAKQPPRVDTNVPDDLAALGLGNRTWDVDDSPRTGGDVYGNELAKIAAEMNSSL
jgi:hypothetical protein